MVSKNTKKVVAVVVVGVVCKRESSVRVFVCVRVDAYV